MPVDYRRNQGPEDSEDYHLYEEKIEKSYSIFRSEVLNVESNREDGRLWNDQRKIYMHTGAISRVKGSAYIEVGRTKVLVSVYEPREIPRLSEFCANGELYCEFRFAPFASKSRRNPIMQSDEKDLSLALKRSLEAAVCRAEFPNFQVDIFVLVIDDDGGSFAAAVTAAGIALADAGVPMYDTVGAVTLAIQEDDSFLDPTLKEEEFCSTAFRENNQMGFITVVYLPTLKQISYILQYGCVSIDKVLNNLDLLIQRSTRVAELSKEKLAEDVLKKCQEEKQEMEVEK